MISFRYTWKIGPEITTGRDFCADKPVTEGTVLADLFDGKLYRVSSFYKASARDRFQNVMPETVMHTWPAGSLSEEQLTNLRNHENYSRDWQSAPLDRIVFV